MCGIIGFFGRENAVQLVISGMNFIKYRGNDGYGIFDGKNCFYSEDICFNDLKDSDFAIGHCLHAVVNKVKQPFFGRGVFSGNCEIYNWEWLCEKYSIRARNDAELFFYLIEKFGIEKAIDLVEGDYAGAYFIDSKIYIFRDRVGVKPMWYCKENGFAFASEKKALMDANCKNVFELNPRELVVYDIKSKEIKIKNLDFYKIEENKSDYNFLKRKLGGYFVDAVAKRIPDVKFGLLFSGGVDSSFIALVLKKLGVNFICYTCAVKGLGDAKDLEYAKKVASALGLDLNVVEVTLELMEKELPFVCRLIESNNVTKVAVALPFYFACKKAREEGARVIFSGLGSEDIFAGYERYAKGSDVNKECYNGLLNIYERDLYRDDVITMYNNLELRVPFLDKELISFALGLGAEYKVNERGNKVIFRDVAREYGLSNEFSFRKRSAAQYGSNFLKAIEKLTKKYHFKTKSEYLSQFYNEGNVRLAALFSSGKDSCYSVFIMKNQNYDIKCLITIDSRNKDSYMYHTPNVDMVRFQAEAMGLPLIMQETSGEKEIELEDLENALIKAKKLYNIEGVVVGAIFSTYQRDRVQKIAEKIGLKVFTPLWHKDQEILLRELMANKFEVIISSVASDGLDESWLGRKIDNKMVEQLIKLNKKNKINVAFEGGEAETFVLDCPMFKKRLVIEDAEKSMDSQHSGVYKIKKVKLINKN